MLRINIIVTIVLAALGGLFWVYAWYTFRFGMDSPSYPAVMAVAFTACGCLGWVLVTYTYRRGDHETRCRKCKYILRGITDPRCPECGEPI
ncbi:MAG: hypothetical protein JSU86_08225 [Phycisphaerales bacterium]|nr:MAG: hypothetical protein JSU86_08225 [Phycisphaerales bacterium]